VIAPSTIDLLRHLAGKPGHDEVKADFRQLLIEEFGAELSALDFERRVPVVRGRLDADPSAPYVASRRTNQEKVPWRNLPGIENRVEAEFLRPVLLGESILPYRIFQPFEAVMPVSLKGEVLDSEAAANRGFDGLHGWMSKAEKVWNADRPSPISFIEQLDYYGKLASQFPLAPLRVVYSKAGKQPAACLLRDAAYVIDHKLYWTAPANEVEAHCLAALLNSETAHQRSESLQSRGQWGARDFDKVVFNLPIPRFDANNPLHTDIAKTAREAEALAASVPLPENTKFQHARGLVRAALTEAGVARRINALVARLLDGG
jgi:hypothetical protein